MNQCWNKGAQPLVLDTQQQSCEVAVKYKQMFSRDGCSLEEFGPTASETRGNTPTLTKVFLERYFGQDWNFWLEGDRERKRESS